MTADGNEHQINAKISLRDLYYDRRGVAQDFRKALVWYQKATRHGVRFVDDRIAECAEEQAGKEEIS